MNKEMKEMQDKITRLEALLGKQESPIIDRGLTPTILEFKREQALIWEKNAKGKKVKVFPRIELGLDYPDVESFVILHTRRHDQYETTMNIEIPIATANRLVKNGKAFFSESELNLAMRHPEAYQDRKWVDDIRRLQSHEIEE